MNSEYLSKGRIGTAMKVINDRKEKLTETLKKNKWLLVALAAGIVLLLVPFGGSKTETKQQNSEAVFSLQNEEARLAGQLSKIKGAGRVSVLLSLRRSVTRELAQDGDETLVISSGSGNGEEVVDLYCLSPEYTGAIIVCDGADSSSVRLEIITATASYTGLSSDNIQVIQMQ